MTSDLRRPAPAHSLSSLSPLAAPYTAGGRPLASDPMNPLHLPPTAPSLHSGAHQNANPSPDYQTDGFRFPSEADVAFYPPYGAWKPSWDRDVSDGEESASWMDPSLSYPVSSIDKGTRPLLNFPSYSDPPTNPTTSRSNPIPNPYRFLPESVPDPFTEGFRSSVVGPMLKEVLSDSFSVASSSPYDKYMYQLESCSSPTRPDPFDPCRVSFDYFDYMQNSEKKETVHVPVSVPVPKVRVSIKAPSSKGGNETGTEKLKVKCGTALDELVKSTGTGTGTSEKNKVSTDQRSDDVDSPCWKGMPAQQHPFSEGQNGNLPTAPLENENPSFVDKKLKSVVAELAEEKPKEEKTGPSSELEASSSNKLESCACEKNEKGEMLGSKLDVALLVKSMHDLSEVLLGFCGEDFELGDFESELLNGAIQNLKTFTGGNEYKNINTWKIYDNIKACGYSERAINERNNKVNLGSNDYKKSILEGVEKLEKGDCDEQAELYKNLWLEAEVALCTMKYELQLARTKSKSAETLNKNTQQVESSGSLGELKPSDQIKPDQSFFKDQPKQTLDSNQKMESPKIKENAKTTDGLENEPLSCTQFKLVGQEGRNSNFNSFGPVEPKGQSSNFNSSFGPVQSEGQNSNFNSFGPVGPEGQSGNFSSSFGPEGQIGNYISSFGPLGPDAQKSNFNTSFGPVVTEGRNSNFNPSFGPVGTEGRNSNFNPSFGPVGTEGQNGNFNSSFGPARQEAQSSNFKTSFGPVGTEGQNSNLNPSFGPAGTEGQKGNFNPSFGQNEMAENTVMARLRILQRRDENNINNFNGENSYFPNYYSLGYNATEPYNNNNTYSSEWEHVAKDEL